MALPARFSLLHSDLNDFLDQGSLRFPFSHRRSDPWATARFAVDSPLEGDGFELPVPRQIDSGSAPVRPMVWARPVRPKDDPRELLISRAYVRSSTRERHRVHPSRNRAPAPAGARNATSNRPRWLRGGRKNSAGTRGWV